MSCNTNTLYIKTGATVQLTCVYKNDVGELISAEGLQIDVDFIDPKTKQVLKSTSTVDGSIYLTHNLGEYVVDAGSSTGWPVGNMPVDILYTANGVSQPTTDFIINFSEGRTTAMSST